MLRDPWTIRHPRLCRIFLVPVSFLILLLLVVVPATDSNQETLFAQLAVYSTMLFIRVIPLLENSLVEIFSWLYLGLVFVLPQLFYSYHYRRRPRESQALVVFMLLFTAAIYFHAYKIKEQYHAAVRFYGQPVSEKDLYETAGKPLYWRRDAFTNRMLGYYTDGLSATYIQRNEKGHFVVAVPHLWLD